MLHESFEDAKLTVEVGAITFSNIREQEFTPADLADEIMQASIVLLPNKHAKADDSYVFPEDTLSFFDYLRENAPQEIKVDICTSDENYQELELHSDVVNLPELMVYYFMLPVVTGLVVNYLTTLKKQWNKKRLNTNIKITVEKNGKTKKLHYEGDIESLERAIKSIRESDLFGK